MILILIRSGIWLLASSAALSFVYLAARRLFYPLELDSIEGVMMDHVVRLASGHPLYAPPSLEFIPLPYMPGFPALASVLARLFGPQFWEIRIVSLLSIAFLACLVVWVLRQGTKSWTVGAAGAGILLMAYNVTGAHYDVGYPDALMVALAIGGLAVLRYTEGILGAVAAGLVLTVAFFTESTAAF